MTHIITTIQNFTPELLEKFSENAEEGDDLKILYAKEDMVPVEYVSLLLKSRIKTEVICVPFVKLDKAVMAFYLGLMVTNMEGDIYCYDTSSDLSDDFIPEASGLIMYGKNIYITNDMKTIFSKGKKKTVKKTGPKASGTPNSTMNTKKSGKKNVIPKAVDIMDNFEKDSLEEVPDPEPLNENSALKMKLDDIEPGLSKHCRVIEQSLLDSTELIGFEVKLQWNGITIENDEKIGKDLFLKVKDHFNELKKLIKSEAL